MKMKNLYILFIAFVIGAFACTDPTKLDNELEAKSSATDSLFIVEKGPFQFAIRLPKDLLRDNLPMLIYKESTGKLVVSIGEGFLFEISQEIRDISELKKALETDAVLKSTFTDHSEDDLLYQVFLMDGSPVSWHYQCMIRSTEMPYFATTDQTKVFNLDQVKKMKQAIASIKPL